jgi:RND family efflux transporter MFP subunit
MKEKIFIAGLIIVLSACGAKNVSIDESPDTIEGKRELLDQKKNQLRQLEQEINALTEDLLAEDPSLKKKKKIVTSEVVESSLFEKYIELEGNVIADEAVNVVAETAGRIIDLKVKEGDYVKKGDLIARLDLETYDKQKAELITQLELAKDIFERQSRLWAQNIGSEVQFLQAKNNKERLEKSLDVLNFQLSKSEVYAPITGVVDRELIKQGEIASPGVPIVQLLNTYNVKVSADLPERYLNVLKRGMSVDVTFPSISHQTKGKVSLLGRSIDPANRTLNFEVDVANPGSILKPNLLAELRLKESTFEDAIVLPIELIQEDVAGNKYVISVSKKGDDLVGKKSFVEVKDVYQGMALLTSGIQVGDQIIIDGARLVADGEGIIVADKPSTSNE